MSQPKPQSVTPEERATMVALAELLRDIFLQQSKTQFEDTIDASLTARGKLLLQ